jgi:hypothetical protein
MPRESGAAKLKVFISYARGDTSAFAEELLIGLELVGFEPFLDRHDIAAGEDWETRLGGLIQAADTIVFVISPRAVKSERCTWEVNRAIALSKRIVPILAEHVPEAEIPAALQRLHYIAFNEPHVFARSLRQLNEALRTDLDWIREHTRIGELALRWQTRGRPEALLLRGPELEAATAWQAAWTSGAPEVTDLQRALISASVEAEAARTNKEREQLRTIAMAQEAQAEALAARERALAKLSRRTTFALIGGSTLSATGVGLFYWGMDAEGRARRERERADAAQKKSVEEAIRAEAMRTDIEGQLVAFAAAPGQFAYDGEEGENSPFTKVVLQELSNPDASLQSALARSHALVPRLSKTAQRPFVSTDLDGQIYLLRRHPSRSVKAIVVTVDNVGGSVRLKNAVRDGRAWEAFFKTCGFDIEFLLNPTRQQFTAAVSGNPFQQVAGRNAATASLANLEPVTKAGEPPPDTLLLFYFSGAGVSRAGANYIMCDDTDTSIPENSWRTMLSVTEIRAWARANAAISVLILDTNFIEMDA